MASPGKTQEEVPEFARQIINALERQGFVYYHDPSRKTIKILGRFTYFYDFVVVHYWFYQGTDKMIKIDHYKDKIVMEIHKLFTFQREVIELPLTVYIDLVTPFLRIIYKPF